MVKLSIVSIVCTLMLSGCGILPSYDVNAKKSEVEKYNAYVAGTLDAYAKVKPYAESHKTGLLDFALKDTPWSLYVTGVKKLTEEEIKSFEMHGIVTDKYFTSLGATSIREVIIVNGKGTRMFLTVIWGKDSVQSVDRVVVRV